MSLEQWPILASNSRWDLRFLRLAREIASWSKDPSTKVGAVLVRPDRTIASTGFNGFPPGIDDSDERLQNRSLKLELTKHAEDNALAFCKENTKGYKLYVWPCPPCLPCTMSIVRAGIKEVISPRVEVTKGGMVVANAQFLFEGGVGVKFLELEDEV